MRNDVESLGALPQLQARITDATMRLFFSIVGKKGAIRAETKPYSCGRAKEKQEEGSYHEGKLR